MPSIKYLFKCPYSPSDIVDFIGNIRISGDKGLVSVSVHYEMSNPSINVYDRRGLKIGDIKRAITGMNLLNDIIFAGQNSLDLLFNESWKRSCGHSDIVKVDGIQFGESYIIDDRASFNFSREFQSLSLIYGNTIVNSPFLRDKFTQEKVEELRGLARMRFKSASYHFSNGDFEKGNFHKGLAEKVSDEIIKILL
jgi:hypothetical protein